MNINYEKVTAQAPVGVVTKKQWQKLAKLGTVGCAVQGFVNFQVRKYEGQAVVMQAGEYGAEPYKLYNIKA